MKRREGLVLLGAGLLLLAGCAQGGTGDLAVQPSATVEESPAATPTATPTATVDPGPVQDPADPTTWIISADGIGPMTLGQPLATVIAATTAYHVIPAGDACFNPTLTFFGSAGQTLANASSLLVADSSGNLLGTVDSRAGPKSSEGLGVGSTVAAVKAAYPDGVGSARFFDGENDTWTVKGTPGWINYEYDGGSPTITSVAVLTGSTPPREYCG